jgi:hypothetical protein
VVEMARVRPYSFIGPTRRDLEDETSLIVR